MISKNYLAKILLSTALISTSKPLLSGELYANLPDEIISNQLSFLEFGPTLFNFTFISKKYRSIFYSQESKRVSPYGVFDEERKKWEYWTSYTKLSVRLNALSFNNASALISLYVSEKTSKKLVEIVLHKQVSDLVSTSKKSIGDSKTNWKRHAMALLFTMRYFNTLMWNNILINSIERSRKLYENSEQNRIVASTEILSHCNKNDIYKAWGFARLATWKAGLPNINGLNSKLFSSLKHRLKPNSKLAPDLLEGSVQESGKKIYILTMEEIIINSLGFFQQKNALMDKLYNAYLEDQANFTKVDIFDSLETWVEFRNKFIKQAYGSNPFLDPWIYYIDEAADNIFNLQN